MKITQYLSPVLMFFSMITTHAFASSDTQEKVLKQSISSYRVGFEELHQKGLLGKGTGIVIVESTVIPPVKEHSVLKGKKMRLVDVSRKDTGLSGFEDLSTLRYPTDFQDEFMLFRDGNDIHSYQIASILIGEPLGDYAGGVVPLADITLVSFSQAVAEQVGSDYVTRVSGTALYTFNEIISKTKDERKREYHKKIDSFMKENPELLKQKVDTSIVDALGVAFKSKAPIIEGSFILQSVCDPYNEFDLSEDFLNFLAKGLEENDQIIVFSFGNEGNDVTYSINKAKESFKKIKENKNLQEQYEQRESIFTSTVYWSQRNYFKQFATHKILKDRLLLVTNVMVDEVKGTKVAFSNGQEYNVSLSPDSCYPGSDSDLQKITVSAFGKDLSVISDSISNFTKRNGTSFSVPVVAGLLGLIREHNMNQGIKLSGPQLIKRLKETCILPDQKGTHYGNGLIDPLGFLKVRK